jgi:hypothetical protein
VAEDTRAADSRDPKKWPEVKLTVEERIGHLSERLDDLEREWLRWRGQWGPWPRDRDSDEPPQDVK